ncbi:MAG: cytochrome c3 family protein, partial [Pseudomonadota bacterium]
PTAKCLSCHDGSVAVGDIAWWNGGAPIAPLDNTKHGAGDPNNVGLGGNMAGNHPVAMPFPYNNTASTYNGVTTGSGAALTEWQSDPTTLNIRLFRDDGTGNITAGPVLAKTGIECSSCHDPHNKASVDTFFLRGRLSGSDTTYLCLKCHVK